MTTVSHAERRRGRRANVQAPIRVRPTGRDDPAASVEETTKNLSLAGAYFEVTTPHTFSTNDIVMASVSIPESQVREFPFRRLSGRCRVVRVSELPAQGADGRRRIGVALEFGEDVTALTGIPVRT